MRPRSHRLNRYKSLKLQLKAVSTWEFSVCLTLLLKEIPDERNRIPCFGALRSRKSLVSGIIVNTEVEIQSPATPAATSDNALPKTSLGGYHQRCASLCLPTSKVPQADLNEEG